MSEMRKLFDPKREIIRIFWPLGPGTLSVTILGAWGYDNFAKSFSETIIRLLLLMVEVRYEGLSFNRGGLNRC